MDIPAVQFLRLEHTRYFLDMACLTHYSDHLLCVFYNTSLDEWSKAPLPVASFAEYVEWVLVQCDSLFTVCLTAEDAASPTLDSQPSRPSAISAVEQPEHLEAISNPARVIAIGYFSFIFCISVG